MTKSDVTAGTKRTKSSVRGGSDVRQNAEKNKRRIKTFLRRANKPERVERRAKPSRDV